MISASKAALRRLAKSGRQPTEATDTLAHLILAAVGKTALLIARAEDPAAELAAGQAALQILLDRLLSGGAR